MEKAIIVILTTLGLAGALYGAYQSGMKSGENKVINEQLIYDDQDNEGFYYSSYKGQVNKYWYE